MTAIDAGGPGWWPAGTRAIAAASDETVHFLPPRRQFRKPRPTPIALVLAPMVDMSFTFLIFFVATTRWELPEGVMTSQMPRWTGQGASAVPLPETPVIVRLSQKPGEADEYAIRIDRFTEAPTSFGELAAFLDKLQTTPGFDENTPVVIVASDEVRWDHVVSCWNAALRAECKNIAFAQP